MAAQHRAVSLYRGRVMHARLRPKPHRFSYRVFSVLIDLDRLEEADRACALFSVNRPNLFSFQEKDHGACDGSSLRKHVDKLLETMGLPGDERGIAVDGGRVLLLCYPRVLGFAFNPLAVYYVFGPDGCLAAVFYEVRNTFGERHTYRVRIDPGMVSSAGLRHGLDKAFHVSPFMGMRQRYDFRLGLPDEAVRIRILQSDAEGPLLVAGFSGKRHDLTSGSVLAAFCAVPLMTLKVVAGIGWEALKLWGKGVRVHPRPRSGSAPLPERTIPADRVA